MAKSRKRDDDSEPEFVRRSSVKKGGRKFPIRESRHGSKNRRDFSMTKVTCATCGDICEVPFKPTSSKPVYCSDCFSKKDSSSRNSDKHSNKDLDLINEKLDKIMKALDVK